jgi:hypothetical protein
LSDHRPGRTGLDRGSAEQRQDHRCRDQTFHFILPKALRQARCSSLVDKHRPCSMNRV